MKNVILTYEGKMIQQGIQQTKQQTLLDQLQTKFGQLPSEISQCVLAIDQIEELDQLLRKILTASSLDEMELNDHRDTSEA